MYYNSLSRMGSTITDPPYLFSLEVEGLATPSDFPLGDWTLNYTAREIICYLAMRGWSVPLKDQVKWIEQYEPVLVVTITAQWPKEKEERRYDHRGRREVTSV